MSSGVLLRDVEDFRLHFGPGVFTPVTDEPGQVQYWPPVEETFFNWDADMDLEELHWEWPRV